MIPQYRAIKLQMLSARISVLEYVVFEIGVAFERVRETDYAENHNNFSDKQHDLEVRLWS